jgi:ABC-type Fe3+ transport system permease subunit
MFYFNGVMFLCVYIYICLFVPVCIRCASQIDRGSFPSFEESTVKLRRPSVQVLRVLQS